MYAERYMDTLTSYGVKSSTASMIFGALKTRLRRDGHRRGPSPPSSTALPFPTLQHFHKLVYVKPGEEAPFF